MKKSLIYILIILGLAALAWYFIQENKLQSSIENIEAEYNFAVADTGAVTKIIIQDKTPSKVVLTRENGHWMVNEKYEARPDAIEVLLETLNRMSMRNFVPIPSKEVIINRLSVYGQEVEVFAGDEKVKHFFVGTETPDQTGTYMMIKGASQPFSVHIQGFVGYLNTRFFTGEDLWRRRKLYNLEKNQIAQVKLEYPGNPNAGFILNNEGEKPVLKTLEGTPIPEALEVNMNLTLGSFKTASYEGSIVPTDGVFMKRDSLMAATPALILTVETKSGETHSFKAMRKAPDPEHRSEDGVLPEFDPNRLYAFLDDGRWVLIQYYGLRNILVEREFYSQEILFDN